MSGIYDLTGKNIENTYQRVLQTPDGTTFYDGTGSLVTLPNANTASLLTTASAAGNTITFTKGDGSTFQEHPEVLTHQFNLMIMEYLVDQVLLLLIVLLTL